MVNKRVFNTGQRGAAVAPADVTNRAGGKAYSLEALPAVTQFAMTGTFADKFYHTGQSELDDFVAQIDAVEDSAYLAKLAVYARYKGKMKDAPLVILAKLFNIDGVQAEHIFPFVVNTPKQLRSFAQIIRSGAVGRKSFGQRIKRAMTMRFQSFDTGYLCARGLIGNDPSMGDVIKMLHPAPVDDERRALYGYMIGAAPDQDWTYKSECLPEQIKALRAFIDNPVDAPIPKGIDMMQIMGLMPKSARKWVELVSNMSWTQVFKNLNTMSRHGVFDVEGTEKLVAGKLLNEEHILRSMSFPYQLLMAYRMTTGNDRGWEAQKVEMTLPNEVKAALRGALNIATRNTPELPGKLVIGVDSSGSMACSITGDRGTATSQVSCVDVAGLFAASCLRANPNSVVVPFDSEIHMIDLIPEDSVITICDKLPTSGGSTDVSLVLQAALAQRPLPDAVIILSDMESWVDSTPGFHGIRRSRGTSVQALFNELRSKVPHAKLVCWNLQVGATAQAKGEGILSVGGFSEAIWTNVQKFLVSGTLDAEASDNAWVDEVHAIDLMKLESFIEACLS